MPDLRIKTIIADGDESSVQMLKQLIQSNCPEIEIVSVCSTLKHTVDSIKEYSPGLIFIETELPDGSSLKMLQMWPDRKFRVVFVSTNPDYAVQAFRFSVSDYLIKPVIREQLNCNGCKGTFRTCRSEFVGWGSCIFGKTEWI